MTGEKDFSDIDVERPEIMTPAEFIRKERSRYVENVPCVCFFRCQHTIKQASAKLSYVVVYPTSQVYTSRVLFSFTVRDYKKRFESSVGLQVCEYQAFDGGIFFSGTGSFAPFDMVTVNRSILRTHSGLMRKPA